MSHSLTIAVALLLPALGALVVALCGRWPNVRDAATLVVSTLTFLCVCTLVPAVQSGIQPTLHLFEVLPGLPLLF